MNCGYPRRSDYRCRGGWRQRSSASVRRSAPFRRGWRSHLASAIVLCRCLSPRPRTLWTNLHLSTSPPPLRNQGHTEPAINRTTAPIVIALARPDRQDERQHDDSDNCKISSAFCSSTRRCPFLGPTNSLHPYAACTRAVARRTPTAAAAPERCPRHPTENILPASAGPEPGKSKISNLKAEH